MPRIKQLDELTPARALNLRARRDRVNTQGPDSVLTTSSLSSALKVLAGLPKIDPAIELPQAHGTLPFCSSRAAFFDMPR
jgi:hypothetical protein